MRRVTIEHNDMELVVECERECMSGSGADAQYGITSFNVLEATRLSDEKDLDPEEVSNLIGLDDEDFHDKLLEAAKD